MGPTDEPGMADDLPVQHLTDIHGRSIPLMPEDGFVHLQFRRFARCPICNLHLQSFARRRGELASAGVTEVAVFYSSDDELRDQDHGLGIHLVADPDRELYRAFGVDRRGLRAVLHPKALWAAVRGVLTGKGWLPRDVRAMFGMPADLLIASDGSVVAQKRGRHADDQWSVDDVLRLTQAKPE